MATNKAFLPDTGITKAQIDSMITFSHSIGANYTGTWLSKSKFRITILDGSPVAGDLRPYPPFIGLFGLSGNFNPAAGLRNTPATCGAADSNTGCVFTCRCASEPICLDTCARTYVRMQTREQKPMDVLLPLYACVSVQHDVYSHHSCLSIYLSLPRRTLLLGSRILGRPNTLNSKYLTRYITGAFGASRINITSFEASSTASDSVFGAGDLLTVTFSEPTNQVRSDNWRMLHSYWMLQGAL